MSTTCGIFWDIQNVAIPKQKVITPESIYNLIKEQIILKYNLSLKDFYVVGATNTVTENSILSLQDLDATFERCGPEKNAADLLIKNRMDEFISKHGNNVALIVLTGDADFAVKLANYRYNGATIYTIHKENCASSRIDEISDYVFHLNDYGLELKKSPPVAEGWSPSCEAPDNNSGFIIRISCPNYLPTKLLAEIVNDLSSYHGSYAVHTENDDVWCLFDDFDKAEAACDLKGTYKLNSESFELKTSFVRSPPIYVLNLIECAKLSNPSGLAQYRTGKFNMPSYKPTLFENIDSTINNMQTIINAFNGNPTRQQPSNRSSNTRPNNEECILS